MPGFRYKAFISYSWADRAWGEWLHRALENYVTPSTLIGRETPLGPVPRTLRPIFKDREEEAAGTSINSTIDAALNQSEFLIVICSPRAAKSKWVNREIAWFKTHRDATKILALIIDGEPGASDNPGRETQECFPPALVHRVNADLSISDERVDQPLAADVRNTGDGRNLAKLKIAAAMLGVGLDELARREEHRRSLRRRAVTGGALILAAVMSGLAYTAILARDEARIQRDEARFQRDEAQGLVEFMLTDLRKRLDAVGRLDVLESVGFRALKYFSSQKVETLDADAIGRRARAQLLVGEIANLRGDLNAALSAYQQAATSTAEQLRRNPNSPQQIFDHAQSVFWVGYVAWQRRDLPTARKSFKEYHVLAQRLVTIDPNNDQWQAELGYAYVNLGTLEMGEGNSTVAEAYFRNSLGVKLRLSKKHPRDLDRLIALGQSHAWLADALYFNLRFSEARDQRVAEIELYQRGLIQAPSHISLLGAQAVAHQVLALLQLSEGDLKNALEQASLASDLSDRLIIADPQNTDWVEKGAMGYVRRGQVLFHLHQYSHAHEALSKALAKTQSLLAKDASVLKWRLIQVRAQILLALILQAEGNVKPAQELLNDTSDALKPLIKKTGSNRDVIQNHCQVLALRSHFGSGQGEHWTEIIERLQALGGSNTPESLTLQVEAYVKMGQLDKAHPIAQKLNDAGYRHPDFMALVAITPNLINRSNEAAPPAARSKSDR